MADLPMTTIIAKAQFEGIHCYPDAPEEVAYLKHPHRHMFGVEVEIEVFHDDRELEFIMVKNKLLETFEKEMDSKSCEMIAKEVQAWAKETYPHVPVRRVNVAVFEDGENGAKVRDF